VNSRRNENREMKTRISTGTTVQMTSMAVLWLQRAGVGLERLL